MRKTAVAFLLTIIFCWGASGQAPEETGSDISKKQADILMERVEELGDKIPLDYAKKKKEELLKKYPDLENNYIAFIKTKYPDLESEIAAVFGKYPDELKKYGQFDEEGEPVVNFRSMELMCLNSTGCSRSIRKLFQKKYPEFGQTTARYVLDKKPELLVELAIVTLEVLTAGEVGSTTDK